MSGFTLVITTVERVTIARDSLDDAQKKAAELEAEYNRHHHHGEKTTIVVETPAPAPEETP